MNNLSAIQTLACEATWRALQDRNQDLTGRHLTQQTPAPEAKRVIRDFVVRMPLTMLPKLVLPQMHAYGNVTNHYTHRWADVSEASARFDAHKLAQGNMRMSQMPPLLEASNSSHTRTSSSSHASETTPQAPADVRLDPFDETVTNKA